MEPTICLSSYLSIHLSICLPIYLSICLSIYVCLSIYLSAYLSIYLSIYLPACLSICMSIYLSIYLSIHLLLWNLLLDLGRFFSFLMFYRVGRTPWAGDSSLQGRYLHTPGTAQTQNKCTQKSMSRVGFEPTLPLFERAKTVHASDRVATLIGREPTSYIRS
jgi:hypothetical protein